MTDALKESKFMFVSDGEGICDCCELDKRLVLLVSLGATIGFCSKCLPSVIKGLEEKANELQTLQDR